MVRREIVRQKAARAAAWLRSATPTLAREVDDFLSDVPARDLAVFYLFLALQECIDIAAHWVADEGWGPPDDVGASFDLLADHGVIDRDSPPACAVLPACATASRMDTRLSTTNACIASPTPA